MNKYDCANHQDTVLLNNNSNKKILSRHGFSLLQTRAMTTLLYLVTCLESMGTN